MIKLFSVYYSTRNILLVLCEVLVVAGSFLLSTLYWAGPDTYIVLMYEYGLIKIAGITLCVMLLIYYFDLYEPQRIPQRWEILFRLLLVLSVLTFVLSGVLFFFPQFELCPYALETGVVVLSVALVLWRRFYDWTSSLPIFRERVYVLGGGERAQHIIDTLRDRRDAGIDVVIGKHSAATGEVLSDLSADLRDFYEPKVSIDRIIVAMQDRRGAMPVRELLDLRLQGVRIEDGTSFMERLSGKLSLNGLNPSTFIFTDGFKIKSSQQILRRITSMGVSFVALTILLPFLPFIMLAVRFTSPGPIFFKQTRVGLRGRHFKLYKFRTMRLDAEAGGAVWALKNDPRVTRFGGFMRRTRIDEIPQLWNVLRGDMALIGPRPERPEFVQWLTSEIPYYELRHLISPGVTGWAQVRYQYGATLEETKRKLEYDLYYIKHLSMGIDLLVLFETLKTILLRRGSQ